MQLDLATFLIQRACANDTLANYFYWYLVVECEDHSTEGVNAANIVSNTRINEMYIIVMKRFSQMLKQHGKEASCRRNMLHRQQEFVEKLVNLMKTIARENGNRRKKIDRLQTLLAESEKFKFTNFDPLPLPLHPEICVKGIIPDKATLFKSALMPGRLTFITTDNTEYITIFKHGDDLRQDQLILQIITLMDKLLRRENLDLKLTPYRVLATSTKHGFVQYIDSISVAEVISTEKTIQNYFRKYAPVADAPFGILPEVMDNYVKSCGKFKNFQQIVN